MNGNTTKLRRIGKVKFFHPAKGFGFITDPELGDVFVHYSEIEGSGERNLLEKQRVEYGVVEGPKGWQATNVKVVRG